MERNKRAADLADKPNLFLDPCSSAGLAAISLTAFIPIIHLIALILLNPRYSTHNCSTHTARFKKFDAETIFRIQVRERHLET